MFANIRKIAKSQYTVATVAGFATNTFYNMKKTIKELERDVKNLEIIIKENDFA